MQSFEVSGLWWLPEYPDHPTAGTVSFSPEKGIHLQLFGSLWQGDAQKSLTDVFQLQGITQHQFVLGITDKNDAVTLFECTQTRSKYLSNGFATQQFHANQAYVGGHFTTLDDLKFTRVRVQYSDLFEWAERDGIDTHLPEKADDPKHYSFTYTPPETIIGHTPDGSIKLISTFRMKPGKEVASLSQATWIEIDTTQPLTLHEWATTHIRPFQNLLSLAMNQPNAITNIRCAVPRAANEEQAEPAFSFIKVFFPLIFSEDDEREKQRRDEPLFRFTDITSFDDIASRWQHINVELVNVCNLFFGVQYAPPKYADLRFLIMAQAIEVYDRVRDNNGVLSRDEYKARMKAILEHVPAEYQDWLKDKLSHSNEPRLLDRLIRLLDQVDDVMLPLVHDKVIFAQKVRDTRNYLTHYDQRLATKVARGHELYWVTEALFVLLQRYFLLELGFSSEQCITLFQENSHYQSVRESAEFSWRQQETQA